MAVAREISKVYEECVNGTAAELIEHFSAKDPKGEMVLMIAPAAEKTSRIWTLQACCGRKWLKCL